MIKYCILFSICFATNSYDTWIDRYSHILESDIKSASFKISINSKNSKFVRDSIIVGSIVIDKDKKFRINLNSRSIVSDGLSWKSYDKRNNQIYIQQVDKYFEKKIFSWLDYNKLKFIPKKQMEDGGYNLNFINDNNNILIYFFKNSNEIKSIEFNDNNYVYKIRNIILNIEKSINLNLGDEETLVFDLR